jgi:hypothetical protein
MASSDFLVYIESVDSTSLAGDTPLEHMRAAEKVAAERGHPAETFARTASGLIVTPKGFSDVAFDISPRAQRAVAARSLETSQWGMPIGADYVAHQWILASGQDPANFSQAEIPPRAFAYASDPGDGLGTDAVPVGTYGETEDIRVTHSGDTAITLQFCRDPIAPRHCLFGHDLNSGQMKLITRLPDVSQDHGDLSISPDGRYLIAGYPTVMLVDLTTGHSAGLGKSYRAATWYPKGGASCLLAVTGGHEQPPWELVLVDLTTFAVEKFADLPDRVDGIQVAADGTIAARTRPKDEKGWFDVVSVSTDSGKTFEPVAPSRGSSGWRRRGTRPRWIEPPSADAEPVTLHSGFEEFLREVPPDNGYQQGEAGWMLDVTADRIKQRVLRLRGGAPATHAILSQLVTLTTLAGLFDLTMNAEILKQVVPVCRALGREGAQTATAIADVAIGRQPPPFIIHFGNDSGEHG